MGIRIGFGKDRGLKGKLICALTESSLSHSWFEYESTVWGGWWVAHANNRGVVNEPSENVRERYPSYRIYSTDFDVTDGLAEARTLVGRADYDYLTAIWNLFILVIHRGTGIQKLKEYTLKNASKMTCSEFVAVILKHSGLEEAKDINTELQTTGDVERIVRESGEFTLVEEKYWPQDY